MHIGNRIKQKLREDRRSAAWLAQQICCTRTNIYKILRKSSIDIALLVRISRVLGHDFFEDISKELVEKDQFDS